jgi:hypothetical protein
MRDLKKKTARGRGGLTYFRIEGFELKPVSDPQIAVDYVFVLVVLAVEIRISSFDKGGDMFAHVGFETQSSGHHNYRMKILGSKLYALDISGFLPFELQEICPDTS